MHRAIPTLNVGGRGGGKGGRGGLNADLQFVVKVRGLPFDCTRMALLDFFATAQPRENAIFFVSTHNTSTQKREVQERSNLLSFLLL